MKYIVEYDDLLGHTNGLGEFDSLDKAKEFFKAECYTPAMEYDEFLSLHAYSDEGVWQDTIAEYYFIRLDRGYV